MPEFRLLGSLQVVTDTGPLRLPGKERSLVTALLLHARQVVTVETLIDVLWGSSPPPSARNTVHGNIKRLRQKLGSTAERVVTRNRGYLADVRPGELDLDSFVDLYDRARAEARSANWAKVSVLLADALGIWRGEPLADVPSTTLLESEAARLGELRAQALDLRIEADLQCGRHDEVTAELMQLVAAHPLRERSWAQLMLALYRSGRQGDALGAYRKSRAILLGELGVDPGVELSELHQRILAKDPALNLSVTPDTPGGHGVEQFPALSMSASQPPRPMQTPADVPDFTGRAESIRQIRAALAGDAISAVQAACGVVAISGPGGIGKSALAIHIAHLLANQFPDGQLYHALGGARAPARPTDVLATFLRDLGVPSRAIPSTEAELSAMYRTALADRKMLVLLDNVHDAAQVRPLLPGSGGSAVVVTSRSTLADLAGAQIIELEELAVSEARDLFTVIIGPRAHDASASDIESVLASCAGIPLAIRIAASRLAARPGWTVNHLSRLLMDERRRLGELQSGDLAARASFAVSYRALPPGPARIFRLLGLVPVPTFSLAAVAALAGQSADEAVPALEALVDAHLLKSPAPGQYRLNDLLRIYAAELADRPQDQAIAATRMLGWYEETAVSAAQAMHPSHRFPGVAHTRHLRTRYERL